MAHETESETQEGAKRRIEGTAVAVTRGPKPGEKFDKDRRARWVFSLTSHSSVMLVKALKECGSGKYPGAPEQGPHGFR